MNREYEIEHFGFTAEQFSLERQCFLRKIIRNALDAMVSKFNVCEKTLELLRSAKEEVFENMWLAMKDDIEDLNKIDAKYFTIPDHVLLPPYFDHVKSYTEQDEQEIDKQLDILKKNFLENCTMLASLKLENSQYNNFSTFVENEVKIQQHLKISFNSIDLDKIIELDNKTNNLTIDINNDSNNIM